MLLSNQRHQNLKMGIDEFPLPVPRLDDDPFAFPLPVPRLDDDPFASLSATDIAAMEAAPDFDEASGSEYEEEEEGKDDDE
jgi:hypothetical protein